MLLFWNRGRHRVKRPQWASVVPMPETCVVVFLIVHFVVFTVYSFGSIGNPCLLQVWRHAWPGLWDQSVLIWPLPSELLSCDECVRCDPNKSIYQSSIGVLWMCVKRLSLNSLHRCCKKIILTNCIILFDVKPQLLTTILNSVFERLHVCYSSVSWHPSK